MPFHGYATLTRDGGGRPSIACSASDTPWVAGSSCSRTDLPQRLCFPLAVAAATATASYHKHQLPARHFFSDSPQYLRTFAGGHPPSLPRHPNGNQGG
ncbi:hypothetical protein GUJ93_ZPchr0005g15704 [Zizania palustris]|uniref:Uncharacterized protein n=1 Tax=Zizania palustris TaxID=103762 RepID=A0A8J5VRV5_ZIZPA|nr:hypothetical protein GUJ93_ZPchr0005g15704 [Zizania palustris]